MALAFALPSSYVSIITKFSKNVKSKLRNDRNIAHCTKGVCLAVRTIDKINYYLTKENKNGADLCEYLGVSSGVYSQWNTGRTHPRKSKLPIIAEYLGVEVSDIQGDDTNKKEKPTAQGDGLTEKDVICVRYVEKAKKIAKKKGIAFTHISTELGKSRGYLSEMLANGRDLPDHMLADVASLLGVTVDDLRGDTENEKKPTAQSDGLISSLPQDVQEIISLCQKNPRLASALLNLAHQLQNRSSDPA